jgi:RNA polymerase sigma-70 factor (ECF subfamily)
MRWSHRLAAIVEKLIPSPLTPPLSDDVQSAAGLPAHDPFVQDLYRQSKAEQFGFSCEQFTAVLSDIRLKYLSPDSSGNTIREFYTNLKLEDLVLARACAAGNEPAWEVFMLRFREKLYDVASYIAKESSAARELADSVYADLYGTTLRDGHRVCKLSSYTGRGSLEGWLRTVLAQEYVNRYRRGRRLVSLDEESEEGVQFAAATPEIVPAADPRVASAIDQSLAALPSQDRFILASYYLDERTLAAIAGILGVHESTISRKLDKLAKSLRKQILAALGRAGMSRRQAQEALDIDVRDLQVNIRQRLAQESPPPPFSDKKAKLEATDGSG